MKHDQVPNFVTFTGVDEKTDFADMVELSKKYPIEWGFLYTAKDEKAPRYTGAARLMGPPPEGLKIALHMCGKAARICMESGNMPPMPPWIGRVQMNLKDNEYKWAQLELLSEIRPIIRQTRDTVNWPLTPLNVAPLLDCSGGTGKQIMSWPLHVPAQPVGYAGGISADNVADLLDNLPKHPHTFWIDMETSVRTDDWFDLSKCEAVCKEIWG